MDEKQIVKYMVTKTYIEDKYICWDFVRDLYIDLYNVELPEYPVDEVQTEFKHKLVANFPHIKIENESKVKEGDIIVFSLFANQHAGVIIDKDRYIHLSKNGVEVKELKALTSRRTIYRIIK